MTLLWTCFKPMHKIPAFNHLLRQINFLIV